MQFFQVMKAWNTPGFGDCGRNNFAKYRFRAVLIQIQNERVYQNQITGEFPGEGRRVRKSQVISGISLYRQFPDQAKQQAYTIAGSTFF